MDFDDSEFSGFLVGPKKPPLEPTIKVWFIISQFATPDGTRRKLVSTNRRGTVMRPSWECRRSVVGGFLIALPRRFRGRFLTIKRRFVETVVALSWRGSGVDASWTASWHRRGRAAGRLATTVSWKPSFAMSWRGSVVDALWMMLWDFPGRVASCPAMTVLWKPSWHPNVHDCGHYR